MGKTWDDAANAKLLLAIIKEVKLAGKYDVIAQRLGNGLTGNAIKCHIFALQRKVAKDDGDDSAPTTPTKQEKGKPTGNAGGIASRNPKSNSGRKRKRSAPLSDSEDSEAFEVTPPPKKVKPERRAAAKVASENGVGAGEASDSTDGYLA